MLSKKYSRYAVINTKIVCLALVLSCLMFSSVNAAGLGKLTVLSALGQPLRAEIELTSVTKDDVGNISPKLANMEIFQQANIDFKSELSSLHFTVEKKGGRYFVAITSTQSFNEPFLELLIELNSSTGKLTREYTLLIDPLEIQLNNTTPITSPVIIENLPINPSAMKKQISPIATSTTSTDLHLKNTEISESGNTYQIKKGDTLSKISNQYKYAGISLDQILVAIHKKNSKAFINNNMNLLRTGQIIIIPSLSEIQKITKIDASKIVHAQSADFNIYRNKLANQVAQSSDAQPQEPKKIDAGKITAKVTDKSTLTNESKDKLKLSKTQDQTIKNYSEEHKIAEQKALNTVKAREKELESNAAKLQKILELKNNSPETATNAQINKESENHADKTALSTPLSVPTVSSLPKISDSAHASESTLPKANATPKASLPSQDILPGLFDNWLKYLPIISGILGITALACFFFYKRKKKAENNVFTNDLANSSIMAKSLFGSTGGQSVDTSNSVFNSSFAPSASQLDANEVDPVAEADVYIAYGRDEQAEEILKEALKTQPDRQAVRVKLLEIYAHRKDLRSYDKTATELYGMSGGSGPEWAQAASLGIVIDPQNPLYSGGNLSDYSASLGVATVPIESLDPEELFANSRSIEKNQNFHAPVDNTKLEHINTASKLDFDLGLSTANANEEYSVINSKLPINVINNADQSQNIEGEIDRASLITKNLIKSKENVEFEDLDFDFAPKVEQTQKTLTHLQSKNFEQATNLELTGNDLNLSNKKLVENVRIDRKISTIAENLNETLNPYDENLESSESETSDKSEMNTKLDLAIAYQEIGDKDGSKELLEEVIRGGNSLQIKQAKKMLDNLS